MQLFFDNGNQHVSGNGALDLCFHRILAGADKTLAAQMLLDPLEERLNLPAAFVFQSTSNGPPTIGTVIEAGLEVPGLSDCQVVTKRSVRAAHER